MFNQVISRMDCRLEKEELSVCPGLPTHLLPEQVGCICQDILFAWIRYGMIFQLLDRLGIKGPFIPLKPYTFRAKLGLRCNRNATQDLSRTQITHFHHALEAGSFKLSGLKYIRPDLLVYGDFDIVSTGILHHVSVFVERISESIFN